MKGLFITFEGVEGCGKSTQAQLLFDHLRERGYTVFITREPGGTMVGKKIRELVLHKEYDGITQEAELFLYLADRAQHVSTVIKPHLDDGGIVICDRFADSTLVYQGFGRGIDPVFIKKANLTATQKIVPDMTFIFDIDTATGLKRAAATEKEFAPKGSLDRIESAEAKFHDRIRSGFLQLAKKEPRRCRLMNGALPIKDLQRSVCGDVHALLKRRNIIA
ncbi:MAG TPA: dTMP kinase [bacterium]|nr:dTMP kinase [bacterium]